MDWDADLLFTQLVDAEGSGHLLFGDDEGQIVGDEAVAEIDCELPPISVQLLATYIDTHAASIDVELPPIQSNIVAEYESGVYRGLVATSQGLFEQSALVRNGIVSNLSESAPLRSGAQILAEQSQLLSAIQTSRFENAAPIRASGKSVAEEAKPLRVASGIRFETAAQLHRVHAEHFEQADMLRIGIDSAFETAIILRTLLGDSFQEAQPLRSIQKDSAGIAALIKGTLNALFEESMPVPPRRKRDDGTGPQPEPEPCYTPDARLLFCKEAQDGSADLLFECCDCSEEPEPGATVVVPVKKVYVMQNHITLTRLDNGATLHPLSFSASLDCDSWTWTWSATLHETMGKYLGRQADGEVPIVEARINGQALRLRIESNSLNEQFNPTRWQVGGRGINAILADRHAPIMNFTAPVTLTAQQIANQVLTLNGVGIDWDVDWQIPDWSVPGGTWVHKGRYMDAINDIARAVGAYVQPHMIDQTLRILPRYPVLPWHWDTATAVFDLPAGLAVVRSTDFVEKPEYNRIWVQGESVGVAGFITRTGTAGDVIAEQAVHPLITAPAAQRARGEAELANSGKQEHVSLRLPVLPETGLILPGTFIRQSFPTGVDREIFGITRKIDISYAEPVLRQTITLEAHPNV